MFSDKDLCFVQLRWSLWLATLNLGMVQKGGAVVHDARITLNHEKGTGTAAPGLVYATLGGSPERRNQSLFHDRHLDRVWR
jgi:hypothetical protein